MDNRILNVLSAVMDLAPEQISEQTSVETVPQWDSLKHLKLVLALENDFDLEFSDQEIHALTGYECICKVLASKGIVISGG